MLLHRPGLGIRVWSTNAPRDAHARAGDPDRAVSLWCFSLSGFCSPVLGTPRPPDAQGNGCHNQCAHNATKYPLAHWQDSAEEPNNFSKKKLTNFNQIHKVFSYIETCCYLSVATLRTVLASKLDETRPVQVTRIGVFRSHVFASGGAKSGDRILRKPVTPWGKKRGFFDVTDFCGIRSHEKEKKTGFFL